MLKSKPQIPDFPNKSGILLFTNVNINLLNLVENLSTQKAAVFLENVYKLYNNVPVVNDVSFKIKAGEIFALLGPNGAGKSTIIQMLTTLTKPSQGRIEVGGYDVMSQGMLAT